MDASTLRLQTASLTTAVRYGQPILVSDLELVEGTMDVPVAEVAAALGRSYHATCTMRSLVRRGDEAPRPTVARVAASDRPYRGFMEGDAE